MLTSMLTRLCTHKFITIDDQPCVDRWSTCTKQPCTGKAAAQGATLAGLPAPSLFTLARDGALLSWAFEKDRATEEAEEADNDEEAATASMEAEDANAAVDAMQSRAYAGGRWRLLGKQFLWQQEAQVRACDYHRATAKLLVAYTNGLFELYQVRWAARMALACGMLCSCA